MNGLSLQVVVNSSGVRFSSRVISFLWGMFVVYGASGVWVQRNGRYNTSEKTLSHWIFERSLSSISRNVARQEPRHSNEPDLDLGDLMFWLAVRSYVYSFMVHVQMIVSYM